MFCRALAQEDVTSGPGTIAEAAGQAGKQIYSPGDAAESLYAYLTRKAGMYPDIVEQLVANHLEKGDSMSALITSEWYMRPKHFSGWGRPYEFTAGLYRQLGRLEESRDSVSCCCSLSATFCCPPPSVSHQMSSCSIVVQLQQTLHLSFSLAGKARVFAAGKGCTKTALVEPLHRLCSCQADGWASGGCNCSAESA